MIEQAWTLSVDEALGKAGVNPKEGLSHQEVNAALAKFGPNELKEEESTPLWKLILEQFQDQLVIILLGSAVVSLVLALVENEGSLANALVEPSVIFLILIANATVGVLQERNADQSIQALRAYSPEKAIVVRDKNTSRINASDLVPGDIVMLSTGDRVPADCRVIELRSASLQIDQAILTGESESVYKSISPIADEHAVKQDMTNMLFAGTTVVSGHCVALVCLTADRTAIGNIHAQIGDQTDSKTPLQEKLDEFGDLLAKTIMVICILVWVVNIRHFGDPSHHGWMRGAMYYFKIAVALAVAAIPEGLAAVITACLALGTQKMARKNAIVRHLPSVETLGSTSVICSDKTGTLTTNEMSVARVFMLGNGLEYTVTGSSFHPEGDILLNGKVVTNINEPNSAVQALAETCAVCNDAKIIVDAQGRYKALGQATEAALHVLVEKLGHHDPVRQAHMTELQSALRAGAVCEWYAHDLPRLATLDFSRDRKLMSTFVRHENGHGRLLVKGAPESVVARATHVYVDASTRRPLDDAARMVMKEKLASFGSEGLRTLAIAIRDDVLPKDPYAQIDPSEYSTYESELSIVGFVGMRDPPRPEVREAVHACMDAGVRIVVITGDNQHTAEAICRQIGLFGPEEDVRGRSITGRDLDQMSEEEKTRMARNVVLLSRTEPSHKSQLVDLLQNQNEVVAMTGDGVNDAPALKRADIGVAMGTGTDVAKLAADMVLADNNFATIVSAIEQGRSIFNNTASFIRYLISSNIGEVVSIFLTVLLGMPEALIPVQLLWVNLVTDGLPATALGFNPPDRAVMRLPPRKRDDPLITRWLFVRYLLIGVYVGVATILGYAWWFVMYQDGPQISVYQLTHFHRCSREFAEIGCQMFVGDEARHASTMSLSILVTIEMFNALNALSEVDSLLTHSPLKNLWLIGAIILSMALHMMILYVPYFQAIFSIAPLNWNEWMAVLGISAPIILIDEVCKWLTRRSLPTSKKLN
ncbi:ca-transporting atpase [Malassezia pachydermatis]|uniref:Calcium-transporting ATPase n=1 Tax=Malassezia pachydermatis TaxID=77020 RepID=A0A0M9VR58_9BASI|nr:ca-transporting atpase [Malassezia pachydermatis]KOS16132.1 ca-transporting atpase [Malassezia pachydermatis]